MLKQIVFQIAVIIILFICESLFAESENDLKNKIKTLHKQQKFADSIVFLRQYLKKKTYDIDYHFLYAKALLFRKDLKIVSKTKNIHLHQKQKAAILQNYKLSAKIFQKNLLKLEKLTQDKKKLGQYFFLLSMAQWFSMDKLKAIHSFKKSLEYDPTLNEANYNIAALYESLNKKKQAQLYFDKYLKNK